MQMTLMLARTNIWPMPRQPEEKSNAIGRIYLLMAVIAPLAIILSGVYVLYPVINQGFTQTPAQAVYFKLTSCKASNSTLNLGICSLSLNSHIDHTVSLLSLNVTQNGKLIESLSPQFTIGTGETRALNFSIPATVTSGTVITVWLSFPEAITDTQNVTVTST